MTLPPGNESGNAKKEDGNGMSATSGPLDHEAEMAGYDARSEKEGEGEGEGEKKIGDVGGVGGKGGGS